MTTSSNAGAQAPNPHARPITRYRRLGRGDQRHLKAHFLRLHPEDLRQRFMGIRQRLPVHRYVRAMDWDKAVLVGCFIGRSLRGVCELHPADRGYGEVAISLERRFQRRGHATELFRRTLLLARNRGLNVLELRCFVHNQRMKRLVSHFDGQIRYEDLEASAVIRPLPATTSTLASEWVEEVGQLGQTLYRFWLDHTHHQRRTFGWSANDTAPGERRSA